jgi:hypothetical protein
VWVAPSTTMNPTLPASLVARRLEEDPDRAASEYLAQFRSDIAAFIAREVVDSCVVPGCFELRPIWENSYIAFADPSGGSSDSFTLAIAHSDSEGRGILDCLRERRPPFSPDDVVAEFAATLRSYGITTVTGDRYAGDWPKDRFLHHGITYEASERTKSQIYQEALPLLNSGKVELLDHSRLVQQLCSLERRTARGGRDSIDHAIGSHDDVANAACGALVLTAGEMSWMDVWKKLAS